MFCFMFFGFCMMFSCFLCCFICFELCIQSFTWFNVWIIRFLLFVIRLFAVNSFFHFLNSSFNRIHFIFQMKIISIAIYEKIFRLTEEFTN